MSTVLNDRYELESVLGSGGMGEVYRARDLRLGRTVAVKLLRHGPLADELSRTRQRNEAQLAASIHHPGVAQVFDHDEDRASATGDSFIVMQHVEGHSLSTLLNEHGAMATDQVLSIVEQVASGLQAVHDAGVVHRDVKPANIMLTPAGRAVLVDFGIARSETSEPLTDTGTVLGTAQYSSPEQNSGQAATPQSDLYALGVVARHCLTGESPFRRESPIATAMAHLQDPPPPLPDDVPAPVRDLLDALVAKNPGDRPATAGEVAQRAAALGADQVIDLPPTLQTPALAATDRTAAMPAVADAAPARRRHRRGWLAAAVAAALLVLLGAWAIWPDGAGTPVPDVVGLQASAAESAIRDAGLTPKARTVDDPEAGAGTVVDQDPDEGSTAPADGVVEYSVASGQVAVSAEDVVGLPYAEAAAVLEKLGLVVERDDVTRSGDTGDVVAIDRSGRLDVGSTVTLQVAVAPAATTPVPAPASEQRSTPDVPDTSGPGGEDDKGKPGKDKPVKDKKKP